MSIQNVEAFFNKVESDKGLQEKLKALVAKQKAHQDRTVADLIAIAAEAGCDFSANDLIEAREQATTPVSEGELRPVSKFGFCGPMDIIFRAPCTCGYSKPCNSEGLA